MNKIILLFYIFFASHTLYANTNDRIKNQEQNLKNSQNLEKNINKKLDDLAKDIKNSEEYLVNIASQIQSLKTQIESLQDSQKQAKDDLELLINQNKTLVQNQKNMEQSIVRIIAEDFSFDLLMVENEGESEDSIIAAQSISKLNSILKEQIRSLAKNYDQTTNIIREKNQKISTIENSIKEFEQKKINLLSLQKKQTQTIADLKQDKELYVKKLSNLKDQQAQMRQTLQQLSILAQKENEEKSKQTVKSQKKQIRQSYSGSAVYKYNGKKTIAPLDEFSVKQYFGNYVDPIYNIKIFNESVVLSSKIQDAKVKNVLDGKVILAKHTPLLNNVVIIENKNEMHTIYANLSQIAPTIKVGSIVPKGYIIGRVSSDLTFEVTQKNYHIDPLELISLK